MNELFLTPESLNSKKTKFILVSTIIYLIIVCFTFYTMTTPQSKEEVSSQQRIMEIMSANSDMYKVAKLSKPDAPFETYKFNIHQVNSKLYSDVFIFKHRLFMKKLVKYCSENPLDSTVSQINCANAEKVNSVGFFLGKGAAIIISALTPKVKFYIVLGFIGFIILFKAIRFNYFIGAGFIFIISQLFFL